MNSKIQEKMTLEELLYYIMFSLLLSLKGFGLEEGTILFRAGLVCAILLFGMKVLVGNYSIRELVLIALGGLWSIYIFFNMGSLSIVVYALIILGMKNISVSKVMKVGTVVWSVCFFLTVTAAIFADRVGVRVVHEKLGLGPVLRESLGYAHPNVLHVTYIVLMAFILYACRKENIFKTLAGLMVGNILVFVYSMSYTGLLISVGMIFVYLYFTFRKDISLVERILVKCVLPLCVGVSAVLPPILKPDTIEYNILNLLLNNRIWAMKYFFDEYDLTLFGERILVEKFSLDNSYIYALAWYGVVFLAVMVIGYWVLVKEYLKEDRRKELAIIITFLIAGLTEQFLFNASIKNITFIFLGHVFFKYIRQEEKELKLASKYNQVFDISLDKLLRWIEQVKGIDWKKTLIRYAVINILILTGLFFISTNDYSRVYVNERMCDCGGELVSSEQIENAEDTLIIGNVNDEDQYYYFTEENSNFIAVMDVRYKLSLSVYISVFITIISICFGWRKAKRDV